MPKGTIETRCTKCGITKPNAEFRFHRKSLFCKKCEIVLRKKRKTPEQISRYRETARERRLVRIYGLNGNSLKSLIEAQKGGCKICKRKFTRSGETAACVDHCHHARYVRGILCNRCNRVEGFIKTSTNALALYQYLLENELFEK